MCNPRVKPVDSGQRCPHQHAGFALKILQFNRKIKPSSKLFHGLCGGPKPLWPQQATGAIAIELQVLVSLCLNDRGQFILPSVAHGWRVHVHSHVHLLSQALSRSSKLWGQKLSISGLVSSATAFFPLSLDQLGDVNNLVSAGSLYASLAIGLAGFSKVSFSSLPSLLAISLRRRWLSLSTSCEGFL